jgi:ABC-type phosphate transport system substrate-binding protein
MTKRKMDRMVLLVVLLVTLGVSLLPVALPAQAEPGFQVVVNGSNAVGSLTLRQVSSYFLRKSKSWPDGQAVEPVDLPAQSGVREAFSRTVHKKAVSAVRAYWNQQIFSGLGVPPPSVGSDTEVLEYVRSRPGAIGYVSSGAAMGQGVKAISITE